jgi:hypothetical protein
MMGMLPYYLHRIILSCCSLATIFFFHCDCRPAVSFAAAVIHHQQQVCEFPLLLQYFTTSSRYVRTVAAALPSPLRIFLVILFIAPC